MKSLSQKIEAFTNQKIRERIREVIQPGNIQAMIGQEINSILADAFNNQLEAERNEFLGRQPYERMAGSPSRNGFKLSWVPGLFGRLTLRKPVIRQGSYRSPLLGALKAAGKYLASFLATRFWLRGTATRATAEELNAALGTKLSHSSISTLTNALEPTLQAWEKRPIPENIAFLFLDACYIPVRKPGFTSKQALLAALGVDPKGHRHVLGFLLGDRESLDSWQAFIKDLLKRGLIPNNLKLVLSDEHKAIEQAVKNLLPVPHQLCLVHKMRNLKVRVAAPNQKSFLADFKTIYWAPSKDMAFQASGRFQERWGKLYPKAVSIALDRFDDFTQFMILPPSLWDSFRSTNFIERFNREIKRRFRPAGTMHSELEVLKLIWSVSSAQENRWGNRILFRSKKAANSQPGQDPLSYDKSKAFFPSSQLSNATLQDSLIKKGGDNISDARL